MIRFAFLFVAGIAIVASATPAAPAAGQKWYEKAVTRVEGAFTPAEAKPGQTVTFTLTVELKEGYHTYPTVQTDKAATGMINEIKFPNPGTVIFVDTVKDPKDVKTKAEPAAQIAELRYYTGTVTYTRKAVVSPKAKPGATTVKLTAFNLSVCDKDTCYVPKTVPVEASIKVLDGPAAPVEKDYVEAVKKALGEK